MNRTFASRVVLLRNLKNAADTLKQSKRNSGAGVWSYRTPPPLPSKRAKFISQGLGGICWYWILYHIATEPEHIFGEWQYVYPDTWTDEELGIPPDSVGPLKK